MKRAVLRFATVAGLVTVSAMVVGLVPTSGPAASAESTVARPPGSGEFVRAAELLRQRLPVRALVKARYGIVDERVDALIEDPSFFVRKDGEGIFVDRAVPVPIGSVPTGPELDSPVPESSAVPAIAEGAPPPSSQAFFLHSRPSSSKTLFLDFDGATVGSFWATAGQPTGSSVIGFDLDGFPASFNSTELTFIRDTWLAVTEDYAAFDVDVTTEQPPLSRLQQSSGSDAEFGTVLAVTNNNFFCASSCSGVAGVDVFDFYPSISPGGWAFTQSFFDPAVTALIIAHEAGHTLGLSHDGTSTAGYYQGHGSGVGAWSPIMGSASFFRTSQWSRGEYTGANNSQDDLGIISSTTGYIPDTVGDTNGAAFVLPAGNVIVDPGLIQTDADVDVFRFSTTGGRLRSQVILNAISPDLDPRLELRDGGGAIVTFSDPAGAIKPVIDTTIPAGTYYLAVSGEGYLGPISGWSGYGSIGQYELRLELPPSAPHNPVITGDSFGAQRAWSPPTNPGGGAITYTSKLCLSLSPTTCTASSVGSATNATFTNLTPNTSYFGTVVANNGFADSVVATSPAVTLLSAAAAPSVQPVVVNESANPVTLTLTWTNNDLRGNTQTGSEVQTIDLITNATSSAFPATGVSSSVFNTTVAGHRYGMRVRTITSRGSGDWSAYAYGQVPGRIDAPQAATTTTIVGTPTTTRPAAPQAGSGTTIPRGPAPQA